MKEVQPCEKKKRYVAAEYVFARECISRVAPFATISSLPLSSRLVLKDFC